ncbi:MAG: class I tRNA ligase family protein, partial [Patescibacteria group bacterium]
RVGAANTFFLMRHGERDDISREVAHEYARQDEIIVQSSVDADVHVTAVSKEELKRTAEELKKKGVVFAAIYASPFIRTQETAGIFSEVFKVPVVTDGRIGELNHGSEFEGRMVKDYRAFFKTPLERFTKVPEGGESLNGVRRRMMDFAREVDAGYEGKNILVISHGDPLWILEGAMRNKTKEELWEDRITRYIKQGEMRETVFPNYPFDEEGRLNLHRPYIDEIALRCDCGSEMKRIPEVFDCWFESGSMPYGQQHYMGGPIKNFPAAFIAEALDQTRGWFYSLHVLASALFESPAYTHVLATGLILAEDGQKMSKHLKNYPDPMDVVATYGADALRLYLLLSPAAYAEDLNFSEKGVNEVSKKIIARLSNVYSFYRMYAEDTVVVPRFDEKAHALDKFICYELLETIRTIESAIEVYRLDKAARAVADFVDAFSTVYLQYSRDRFKEGADGRAEALGYFRYVLVTFAKITAPFAPFLVEWLYSQVKYEDAKESVHLEDWPKLDSRIVGYADIWKEMDIARSAIEGILAARSAAGISVRQPLAAAKVREMPKQKELCAVIRDRVNVEKIEEDKNLHDEVWIDTELTEELREKGMLREFIRGVQEARKKENLVPGDRIKLSVQTDASGQALIKKFEEEIKHTVTADSISLLDGNGAGQIIKLEKVS